MNAKILLANLLSLSMVFIFPAIPEVEVWSDGTNYRYLLKDWHRDYLDGRVSIKQQADILWAAEQQDANDVFVLAEDANNYPGKNVKVQEVYKSFPLTIEKEIELAQDLGCVNPKKAAGSLEIINQSATPLACLIAACQTQKIRNYNTECVQAVALHPLFGKKQLTKQEVVDDLAENIAELRRHPSLGDHERFVQELEELKTIDLQKVGRSSVQAMVLRFLGIPIPTDAEIAFYNKALDLRLRLVDVKTVHKLTEWNNIKHGFVCEGKLHIEGIKPGLTALGYRQVQRVGNADAWTPSEHDSEEAKAAKAKEAVNHALDLRTTFKQLFEKQADL